MIIYRNNVMTFKTQIHSSFELIWFCRPHQIDLIAVHDECLLIISVLMICVEKFGRQFKESIIGLEYYQNELDKKFWKIAFH